jgi:molybdate transport system substrate-binding protein
MVIFKKFNRYLLAFLLSAFLGFNCTAQTLRIAVAANAQGVIKKLQADFKKQTGIETEVIIGASGKLTAQIMNGAPFDVFLSADTEFPEKLYQAGFGLQKPKIYALGSLVVCGNIKGELKNWQKLLTSDQLSKIAIANPKIAPYGKAAEQALKFYGLTHQVNAKLVFGESISQVNTYLQTGVVAIGFTTEAFLYEPNTPSGLKWARVDQRSYEEIAQSAILLTFAKKGKLAAATRFYNYLYSASAKKIIRTNGYHLPK